MTQNAINTSLPIEVSKGGTGASSLTDHGILLGSGTSAVTAASVGANNTILIGTTGSDASFSGTPQVTSISFGQTAWNYYDATGSWTPVLKFGGGNTGITYSTQTGKWIRVAGIYFVSFNIVLTNKGSSTGSATISGFPTTGVAFVGNVARFQNITFTGYTRMCLEEPAGGATSASIIKEGSAVGGTNVLNTDFANNSAINTFFWYFA